MFCIAYALLGIPMTLLLLTAVVERILIPVLYARLWLQNRFGHVYQPMVIYVVHFSAVSGNFVFKDTLYAVCNVTRYTDQILRVMKCENIGQ